MNIMGSIIQLKQLRQEKRNMIALRRYEAERMLAMHKMIITMNTMQPKKVLAFCFLVYDEIVREDIWIKYFEKISSDKYKIFVNSKTPNKIKKSPFFAAKQIPHPVRNTAWGKFSLITAQNALFKEAFKNPDITHFILVSHNTIPIKPFHELYNSLDHHSIIDYRRSEDWEHRRRYYGINNPQFHIDHFFVQSQWCILTRIHTNLIIKDFNYIKAIFSTMRIPDEHCYINYLIHYKKALFIINQPSTLVDFSNGTPNIFKHINSSTISGNPAFFIRKVSPDTKVQLELLI